MPKISVIIPVYNTEKYIKKCLDSLVNQKMKDFEVIVVNDGSKDNSDKIIKEFMLDNTELKINYVKKENGGLSDARNYGMNYVTGKYIMFLDSDDYINDNLFLNLEKYIEQDIDVIKFKMSTVKEDGETIAELEGPIFEKTDGETAFEKLCVEDKYLEVACIYLYKTKYFKENKFSYKLNAYHEDFGLTPLVIMKAKTFVSTGYNGYYYMQTDNSITRNSNYEKTIKKAWDVMEHYDHMIETIKCYEISEKSKMLIKRYYTNTVLLKISELLKKDRKKYIKEIRKRKLYKNIKVNSVKQLIKRMIIKISPNMYLKMR